MVRGGHHLNTVIIGRSMALFVWSAGSCGKTDEAKQIFMRRVAKDLCWMNEEARARLWCQLRRSSTLMLLGLTLTIQQYDSGADFRSTGNVLQSSGPH